MFRRRLCLLSLVSLAALGVLAPAFGQELDLDPVMEAAEALPPGPLEQINAIRALAGVQPARLDPALQESATGHVGYYDANLGDPNLAGMGLHRQTPGMPGFTGASMGERARAAGYVGGTVTENAGYGDMGRAIDWYVNSVNHRLPLIHPNALDLGIAVSEASGFGIISVGLRREPPTVLLPSVYPPDGGADVPTAWSGAETPDPAPGLPRPLGYPLTVAFGLTQRVEWGAVTLHDALGSEVEVVTPRTDWMRALAIIPVSPLTPASTYTASVEASVGGQPLQRTWSFTTAS